MAELLSMTNEERRQWGADTLDRIVSMDDPDEMAATAANLSVAEMQVVAMVALARCWAANRAAREAVQG